MASAKQYENQIYANLRELSRLETELARMPQGDPHRAQKQRRQELVQRVTEQYQREYTKLTGIPWVSVTLPQDTIRPHGSMRGVRALDPHRPNVETLELGRDYKTDQNYVDNNLVKGTYDVGTGQFWLEYADGTRIELDYKKILGDMAPSPGAVKLDVYHRDLANSKIFPNLYDETTTPNIVAMVRETETVRGNAELLVKLGQLLLEIPILAPTGAPGRGAINRIGRATPKGARSAVKSLLGITGNPPGVRLGQFGGADCLWARVQMAGKQVVYQVDGIAATGADAAKVRAAHRQMLVEAADQAVRNGQRQFKMVGKQANVNFRQHADELARSVGAPASGRAAGGINDYEVILNAADVLRSNQ